MARRNLFDYEQKTLGCGCLAVVGFMVLAGILAAVAAVALTG